MPLSIRTEVYDLNSSILFIGGPTGSGKNELALELAARFSGEIVNADSRQIYTDLIVGTNQPGNSEKATVPHHLYNFLHPAERFSAADYERRSMQLISEIRQRGNLALIVGGTGFYMRALLRGIWDVPQSDPGWTVRLRSMVERRGKVFAHRMLSRLDPKSAQQIPSNDSYRVLRALEIYFRTGQKRSLYAVPQKERFETARFYLDMDRPMLEEAIVKRIKQMFQRGWVTEVRSLMEKYPGFEGMPAARSLGYPEMIRHLRGELSLVEAEEIIVRNTLKYGKRQRTWFRNQDRFVRLNPQEGLHKNVESVLQLRRDIAEFSRK